MYIKVDGVILNDLMQIVTHVENPYEFIDTTKWWIPYTLWQGTPNC